jgi:hyperosmotically inducible periplasmic protein
MTRTVLLSILLLGAAGFSGCSSSRQSPDVTNSVRQSLNQAGLRDVSVSQDRDKGVVTLTGHVPTDSDKSQAGSIANSAAGGQVVANEIAVKPPADRDAGTVNSDLDKAISKNLDAALIQNNMHRDVKYDVKNGVVTLTGSVNSESRRSHAQDVAAHVPDVQQVVNELEVKGHKATSTP